MNARSGPKDVFLHLLAIGTLYATVTSFLVLVFQYINELFPDPLTPYLPGANLDAIRFSAAALVIVFPVYLLTSWLLERDVRALPEKTEMRVRKWLLHLTIFAAAIMIMIDLITLVYFFLSGDLTMRFLLKVVTVLAVAAVVFGYELWDVRRTHATASRFPRNMGIATAIVVFVAVAAGFLIVGSPLQQRAIRFDTQRVSDLQSIQYQTVDYWQRKGTLPSSLDNLRNDISGFISPVDPQSGNAYEYRTTGALSFELCAAFTTEFPSRTGSTRSIPAPMGGIDQNWNHGPNRTCFTRTIDPQLYPRITSPMKY